ncbi:MAG TPA: hypothetical protein IGS31_07840 [Oscillatoriales cyanobacterium M4454_W2019_049]|nr:hypothetical protein [Oscillatoriales cyanobacterium M4454_W2019_049]
MTSNDLRKYRIFRDRLLELGEVEPQTIDDLFDNAIALKRLMGKEITPKRQPTLQFLQNTLTSTCDRLGWLQVSFEDNRIAFFTEGDGFDF